MLAKYKWLLAATSKIHFPPDRKAVQQELDGHIEDLQVHYTTIGLDAEAAETAALQAMGDPKAIAADLGQIHRPWLGYLWWMSKGLIALAIAVWLVVSGLQIYRNPIDMLLYHLPGWAYYDYLTWEYEPAAGGSEQYELIPNGAVTTGGYTIRTTRARMHRIDGASSGSLALDFHIDTDWRNEALFWGWSTIMDVRDSFGNTYPLEVYVPDTPAPERSYYCAESVPAWGLGQKAALELNEVPADAEWIEIDIGHSTRQRTLHIDLKEAVS